MRLLGKKFLRNSIERRIADHSETREGVVWHVYPDLRLAEVVIQNAVNKVMAHYPLNLTNTPDWLKEGNSVKINHVGGMRGRVELMGPGSTIPTPIAGGSVILPTAALPADTIFSGMEVIAPTPGTMSVGVNVGMYRILGITYNFGVAGESPGMESSSSWGMGDGTPMGQVSGVIVPIDAPPDAGNYRYDVIQVGTDGVIDYKKGTQATTIPSVPAVDVGHLEVGRILLYHEMTFITQNDIGRVWSVSVPTQASVALTFDQMVFGETDINYITVTVLDQYLEVKSPATLFSFTLAWLYGNGVVDGISSPTQVIRTSNSYQAIFEYVRNNNAGDKSPMLQIAISAETTSIVATTSFQLLDAGGAVMY
jgi:hypothetical protein